MLRIIYGEAGTGKSARLYDEISASAENGEKTFLFVPDQFSFEAEKNVYKKVRHIYSENVTVTMFSRCAQKILHLYGETKEYADETAKQILIKRAVAQAAAEDALVYYKTLSQKRGFSGFALGLISELRTAGMTPSELCAIASEDNGFSDALSGKISDLSVIYRIYDELLRVRFDDRLDDIRRAAKLIGQSDMFTGANVFFDCFDSFSGNQLVFIKALLSKAKSVTFALTTDSPESTERRYRGIVRLIGKLREAALGEYESVACKKRFRSAKELVRVQANDVWQECDWICAKIRLLADEGMRYRDIAVIAPDQEYVQILDSAMRKYDIPCFTDIPEPIITKSFVRFILFTLKALSFSTDDILRYVKSGYVRHETPEGKKLISNIQANSLERLCRTYDIRKRDWLRPFPEKLDDGTHTFEQLRKSIIEPLRELEKQVTDTDGAGITKALCAFVCDKMEIDTTLRGRCILSRDENGVPTIDTKRSETYSAVWDDIMDIFESAYRSLADFPMTADEYAQLLTEVFAQTTAAKPPQVLDAVTVGDPERSRFPKIKALFICGFSLGSMPPAPAGSDAFTPLECEKLRDSGIPAGIDRDERFAAERYTVYRCVNIPEEKLFVTYPLISPTGEPLEPSPYIKDIPAPEKTESVNAADCDAGFWCRTERSAKRYLASIYSDRSKAEEKKTLKALTGKDYSDMLAGAAGELPYPERHSISPDISGKLFSGLEYSPTALTLANDCKFAYFCSRGLELRDDDERSIDARLAGKVIHFCLEHILRDYSGRKEEFSAMSDAQIDTYIDGVIAEYKKEVFFGDFGGAQRFSLLLERLGRFAAKSAQRIRDDLKESGFFPAAFEERLSFDFGSIRIIGFCDRVDLCEKDGKKYIRVVDYKRDNKKITLSDIHNGDKLQMLIYLFGECDIRNMEDDGEEEQKYLPSSVMYIPVGKIKYLTSDGLDEAEKARESASTYAADHSPNALIVGGSPDAEELEKAQARLAEKYGEKKNGYLTSTIISPEAFPKLREYCEAYLSLRADETLSGMAGACPRDSKSCEYCSFSLFCGNEQARPADDEEDGGE